MDGMRRPKVKICGVTTVEDALASAACGADLIGLNFYPPSPRFVELERAKEIASALRAEAEKVDIVGVFVDEDPQQIDRLEQSVGLDLVQYHGDESPAEVARHAVRAIRALRVEDDELRPETLAPWAECFAVLLDAPHATLYGGTGEAWDFGRAAALADQQRLLLAGGLAPENVGEALRAVPDAWGLDVCSGVEASPGRKDHQKLRRFFAAIEEALTAAPLA